MKSRKRNFLIFEMNKFFSKIFDIYIYYDIMIIVLQFIIITRIDVIIFVIGLWLDYLIISNYLASKFYSWKNL